MREEQAADLALLFIYHVRVVGGDGTSLYIVVGKYKNQCVLVWIDAVDKWYKTRGGIINNTLKVMVPAECGSTHL